MINKTGRNVTKAMTTSIMNKMKAALSLKSSMESRPNDPNSEKLDGTDEFYTIFDKLPTNSSHVGDINLSSCCGNDEVDHQSISACSLDDFIGSPINEYHLICSQTNRQFQDQDSDFNRSITATPADSSCGFHNTFGVLEKHLSEHNYLWLSQKQIDYLLLQNKDLAVHDDNYVDIPIRGCQSLHTVNGLVNGTMNDLSSWDVNDEDPPSHLELELEAMNRLRSMWNEEIFPKNTDKNDGIESSPPFDSPLIEKFYHQDNRTFGVQNSNEYIYHVAKRNGQLYIRVRRNLRLDQGKYEYFARNFITEWSIMAL